MKKLGLGEAKWGPESQAASEGPGATAGSDGLTHAFLHNLADLANVQKRQKIPKKVLLTQRRRVSVEGPRGDHRWK